MSNRVEEQVFEFDELILWLSNRPDANARPALVEWIHAKAHETGESGISFLTMGRMVIGRLIEILGKNEFGENVFEILVDKRAHWTAGELIEAIECSL